MQKWIRSFIVPYWSWYVMGFGSLLFTAWLAVSIPLAVSRIVNQIEQCGHVRDCGADAVMSLGLLLIVFRFLSRVLFFWPGRCIEADLRSSLFEKMLTLPLRFFEPYQKGELLSRLSNDVNHVRVFLAFGVLQFCNLGALAAQALYQMFRVNAQLAWACLLPVICILVVGRLGIPYVFAASKRKQEALGALSDGVTEMYSHLSVIQSCRLEPVFLQQGHTATDGLHEAQMQDHMLNSLIYPLMTFFAQLAQVLIVWFGGYLVLEGRLTVGDMIAFDQFIAILAFPLTAMGILFGVYQRLQVALDRLSVLHQGESETLGTEAEAEGLPTLQDEVALLRVQGLTYGWSGSPVLQDVSFDVLPGQCVGIKGEIGSGKTTLLHCLTRLYQPEEGMVMYRGRDVCAWNPDELRLEMGYVLQDTSLFSGTIRENILWGYAASQLECADAVHRAAFSKDIESFVDGWDTKVGENGVRLSGGQKQRLALARAFLRKPKLYLFDDVMSAVDERTSRLLMEHIFQTGSAAVVVSSRESVLKRCDVVYNLEAGQLVKEVHHVE